ncbi:hypothetical protein BLA29_001670 [Euroglyphus maynei]|uniref:CCHC-type domain-containing protein n=1 Tax=Euroglyphus maynei TaxID=6958 RepID=A0A1Y3API2_EURMA|nr:hypothetical protein BLA29_001670 [Euroglyphus maynei]
MGSCVKYVDDFKKLVNELESAGTHIPKHIENRLLLANLPEEFDTMEIKNEIAHFECRFLQRQHVSESQSIPNQISVSENEANLAKKKLKFCTYCKKPGHTIDECYRLMAKKLKNENEKPKIKTSNFSGMCHENLNENSLLRSK